MRAIQKDAEPQSLAQHRASSSGDYVADYDNYKGMDDLRKSLVAEQGGICCYCMQRIRPNAQEMKVEHWACQTKNPTMQLVYSNLLGACPGGVGMPGRLQHCDTKKGDADLSRNPANPAHQIESFILCPASGRIESDDARLQKEIDEVLNLNLPLLVRNRKAVLDGFIAAQRKRKGSFTPEFLRRLINQWNGAPGELRNEYCFVVVYWLRKKLKRATA